MTKVFISIIGLLSVIAFYSCKKGSGSPGNYYVTMDIDNKEFSFSDSLFAIKQSSAPELTIVAYSKTDGQLQWLFSDFSKGLYLDTYDNSVSKVIYQFTINAIIEYHNNAPVIETLLRPNPTVSNPISTTITDVNSTYVEGTFSGVLSNGSTAIATITNGHFKVPFK